MSEFVEIARTDQVSVGQARVCTIGDRKIALFRTNKGFYATDNTCPHRGGPLGEGDLIGLEIVCPWHLWSFSVETGLNDVYPDVMVQTHEVRVEGERVLV